MKLFTCTNHDGHWPVGVASVILANDEKEARLLLDKALVEHGLRGSSQKLYTLLEVKLDKPLAIILCDGNY